MRAAHSLLICLLLAICCAAQEAAPSAELQQRADQAKGVECARLSMQVARQWLEEADRSFVAGSVAPAHAAIDHAVHYARRSVDCTVQYRKGEKGTEIELRILIRRMNDISRTLDSEDRPHLTRSIFELEEQRDRVLHAIFGAAAGKGIQEKKP